MLKLEDAYLFIEYNIPDFFANFPRGLLSALIPSSEPEENIIYHSESYKDFQIM